MPALRKCDKCKNAGAVSFSGLSELSVGCRRTGAVRCKLGLFPAPERGPKAHLPPAVPAVDRLPAPLPGPATIPIDAALVDIAENNSLWARPAAVAGGREHSHARTSRGRRPRARAPHGH